ncbi:MAG: hypothetical protein HRU09_01705 [Oligoflexales bacterium]|nr:hypothetical protein [Oligoflexales bacterium]
MRRLLQISLISLFGLLLGPRLLAECLGNVQGLVEIEVKSCQTINPSEYFANPENVPHDFFNHYDSKTIKATLQSHTGSLMSGKVVGSRAIDTSLNDRTALLGQVIQVFVKKGQIECESGISSKNRIVGNIASSCCNGSINAPCLLPTNYIFKPIKSEVVAKAKTRVKSENPSLADADIRKARGWFKQKQIKPSIAAYNRAIEKGVSLTPVDSYLLGLSYYLEGQQCTKAIPHLEKVRAKANQLRGDLISSYMKRGMLLLARCYAILRDADRSTLVLYEMLADAASFAKEIEIAMFHEDFGWISTTKEFRAFLKKARSQTNIPVPASTNQSS